LTLENLEDRLAPASFATAGTTLSITLNNTNEAAAFSTDGTTITVNLTNGTANNGGGNGTNVTGFGTSTASIKSSAYTNINISDSAAGTSVAFVNSTGTYPQAFNINLSDAASGNVTFSGASTFSASLSAMTAAGFIASAAGSSLTLSGAGSNLALTATGHDILLQGTVNVGGTTSLAASVVQINNTANSFTGAFQLNGPAVASVVASGALNLGTSTLNFGSLGQTTTITAAGNITQSGALTTTGSSGSLDITSTGGSITLTNAGNNLSNSIALGLSVTGTNTVTVSNNGALLLGNVSLGTGTFTVTAGGSITQAAGTTIQTGGALSATVSAKKSDILLNNAGNRIAGAVTVAETGSGFLRDVSLRNAADNALPPTGAPITNGTIRNLTLFFDNNGVALPGYSTTGNLSVTAGGDVTQSAALNIGGNTTVTILGDFGITLANNANVFSGTVGLNATQSTQPVQVVDSTDLTLAASNLGRGTFNAQAVSGDLTSTSAITQRKGAGAATFTVAAGNTISLTGANDFPGTVAFSGATTVSIRNVDYQAAFANLTGLGSVTDLTVQFDNAGIVLPSLTLTNLTVTALGIFQALGSALVVSGAGAFSAGTYPLDLANTGNDFNGLTLNNSGNNDVTVFDTNAVAFTGNSTIGTGRLTVTAAGNITETGGGKITQASTGPADEVQFVSTGGSVSLNGNNVFRGPFSVTVNSTNSASVTNASSLTLGAVTTGTGGAFSATVNNGNINQSPGFTLSFGGTTTFTASNTITLTNRTNTFAGAISLNSTNASIRASGAVVLASSSVDGSLSITTSGTASDSISQTGAITGGSTATFDAGAASITLTAGNNDFASVSIFSTGSTVSVTDNNAFNVGTILVGGGTLTLTAGDNIGLSSAASSIVQSTGNGTITLAVPSSANINLGSSSNVLLGSVTLSNGAHNVTLQTHGNLTLTTGGPITGNLTLIAGGVLTLPANLTTVNALTVSAVSMTVSTDITAGGAVSFVGAVSFSGSRAITAGGLVTFNGNVTAGGALTFTLPTAQILQLQGGTWNEGSNPLTINGSSVNLQIGNGFLPARLIMSGGTTLSMRGNGNVTVAANGTIQAGTNSGSPETVTIANGTGNLTINGALAVGFGTDNDELLKTGSGIVTLGATAQLVGSGLAGTAATPVLASQTELIVGHFANSIDNTGIVHDFFAGSDIVTPAYSFTQVTVKAGGVAAPSGTATGFLPDGDTFTVTSALGKTAGLATVVDVSGQLDIVVRDTAAATATTLTITTTGGGDGQIPVGGLSIHSPGAVTVTAAAANFTGMFTTAGTLSSLTAHDLGTSATPFLLSDVGPAAASTTLTAGVVQNTTITLLGTLGSFKAVSAGNGTTLVSLTAAKFGTITTTGNAAALDLGNFFANLTSTTSATGTVVATATIAGQLGGTWDVRGNVGTVKAGSTASWTLGTIARANAQNGGLLGSVASLSLGSASAATINATGAVTSLAATQLSASNFTGGSFGTISVTGSAALGQAGNFSGSTLTATASAAGIALASLTIAGDLSSSTLTFDNGDATSISVARTVTGSTITAMVAGTRGNLTSITAGIWQSSNVDARTIGSLKVIGNLTAGLFGDFMASTVTVRGNTGGLAMGTFSASGSVSTSLFDVQNGNLTSFIVGRQIGQLTGSTTIQLTDAGFGALGTIQAGDWTNGVTVLARTIGTVASVGAAAVNPASPLLPGGISSDTITTYQTGGTQAAIGKLTTHGDLSNATVMATRGVTTLTVGRSVTSCNIVADDFLIGILNVGRIATVTTGAWSNSSIAVNTFGTVKITGYAVPDNSSATFVNGDVTGGKFIVKGTTPPPRPGVTGVSVGIGTFSVARDFQTNSFLSAPLGITTLTVGGSVASGSQVVTANVNPNAPLSGFLTTFTAGDLNSATVRASSIGTLKTTGNNITVRPLLGSIASSTVAVIGSAKATTGQQAVGTLSVAGDFVDSTLDAPATVGTISVTGRVFSNSSEARIEAGYANGSKLGSLTAGAWGESEKTITTDLVSQAVTTFALKGNTGRGFVGTADLAFIDLLGAAGGVGLGTFTASGTVTDSLFRVSNGDVTSFTVLRFSDSDLLVGFRPVKDDDVTLSPSAANWAATPHKIGTFKTTAPFSAMDPTDSASFVDSDVVAAVLGSLTLSGVNPVATDLTTFGVAFRTSAGASAQGTVKINGSATALTPGATATDGQFHYLGLPG
jgi:hypothetical protein